MGSINMNIKGQVEKVNGKELSYGEFVERYMEKNQPVVLTGLMEQHWRACTDWVTPHGQPNFQFFSTHFGASKVQVPIASFLCSRHPPSRINILRSRLSTLIRSKLGYFEWLQLIGIKGVFFFFWVTILDSGMPCFYCVLLKLGLLGIIDWWLWVNVIPSILFEEKKD